MLRKRGRGLGDAASVAATECGGVWMLADTDSFVMFCIWIQEEKVR